jgi:hypothetical protein
MAWITWTIAGTGRTRRGRPGAGATGVRQGRPVACLTTQQEKPMRTVFDMAATFTLAFVASTVYLHSRRKKDGGVT